jgi:hypothetical protein
VKAISELQLQRKNLPQRHSTKLMEYLSDFAILQGALQDCGVSMGNKEAMGIIEELVMKVPEAKEAFQSAFTNARQMRWGVDQLLQVLTDESMSLLQKLGIEQLKALEFNREFDRRQKNQPHDSNPRQPERKMEQQQPRANATEVVKGTDGEQFDFIKCYKCKTLPQQDRSAAEICSTA